MFRTVFDEIWQDRSAVLSAPDSFRLDFIEPPPSLASYVTTFFKFHSDREWIKDVQPANTGHMMVFLSGEGEARFASGRVDVRQPVSLIGPTNAAMQYVVKGPLIVLGCGFTPAGWRAVTGLSATESADQFADSDAVFGGAAASFFADLLHIEKTTQGAAQYSAMVAKAEQFLLPRLRPILPRHAEIISATTSWLDGSLTPDVEELYARLPVARRQAQRVIGDYFGCAPKQLMRKYRAVRAAMLLNDPSCSDEEAAKVQDLFYDQPHMIREIRHFAGRTPYRLSGEEGTLLSMWLDKENIRELRQ
ncbi:helix-turn-helix domain-containing protein [Sphingorhabdus arenilitoris]|uniref:Helix-turn-helix domain-containing protein n=1 Tax=Sphingorhabdus arenilitoris TaxID=1490041 RepID=A0ABV8RJE3_9SPHN